MMKISAAIISRLEDPLLEKCIASSRNWADEVVVGTCGGLNRETGISNQVEFPRDMLDAYGFAHVRNQTEKLCTGDWIVAVDTDEVFDCTREQLAGECIGAGESVGLCSLRINSDGTQENQWRIHRRLEDIRWRGIVHEELHLDETHIGEFSSQSSIPIVHSPSPDSRVANKRLYTELLCRAFDLPALKSKTNNWWFEQIEENQPAHRTTQAAYWMSRGVANLHQCHANPWATHIPTLVDLLRHFGKDGLKPIIVEFGAGLNSTPFLSIAGELHSFDTDPSWGNLMQGYGTRFVSRYDNVDVESLSPDIAFIDGLPDTRREQIERIANTVPFIVCHDTESMLYGYEHCLPGFRYKYTDMRLVPWTTVVSNFRNLDFMGGGIQEYVPVSEVA